ncbi:MAG: 2OG-Fe(II) oxygenase [Bacteriovoracia bacterium]
MVDKILRELEKEGYCYIPRLLGDEQLVAINSFFDSKKSQFEAARIGSLDNKRRLTSIRGDFTYWLDPLVPKEPFLELFNFLEELKEKLNQRFFLGLQDFECHLAFYPPGTFYKKHLDRFEKDGSRKLSFIFYLNKEWDPADGGELVMYDQEDKEVETFFSLPGSFVCFLSDEYPHEVRAAKKERRSLTGWIHNKIIY